MHENLEDFSSYIESRRDLWQAILEKHPQNPALYLPSLEEVGVPIVVHLNRGFLDVYLLKSLLAKRDYKDIYLAYKYLNSKPFVITLAFLHSQKAKSDLPIEIELLLKVKATRGCLNTYACIDMKRFWIFIQDYYENGNLLDYTSLHELSYQQKISLSLDLLYGLKTIHEKRYLYRDTKITNVFIYDHGFQAVLGDFGSAIYQPNIDTSKKFVTTATLAPEIMSKGMFSLPYQETETSDIWGLGNILFFLNYRQVPEWIIEANKKNYSKALELMNDYKKPDTSNSLDLIVAGLLHYSPKERMGLQEAIDFLEKNNKK
ncbi:MAG: hypothetical protein Tsb0021_00280 [Chlamydiales bacterium]